MQFKTLSLYIIICLTWTGCIKQVTPASIAPVVSIEPAAEITRTSASLQGNITYQGKTTINYCRFRYGTTSAMEQTAECSSWEQPKVHLEELVPGTTYFFCMEAGNGHQSANSTVLQFETLPNSLPTLDNVQVIGETPMSVILSCSIKDNGGEPLTYCGFTYKSKQEDKETELEAVFNDDKSFFTLHIPHLQPLTSYEIKGFAENSLGRSYTESIPFKTQDVIRYTEPGSLSKLIHEEEKYNYTQLRIAAPLNGDDCRVLREMAGRGLNGKETPGKLRILNLGDAQIVSGGGSYDGSRFTIDNEISHGLLADLSYLEELQLPQSAVRVAEEACKNSPRLKKLILPFQLQQLTPSSNCPLLEEISITATNPYYTSIDGLLYSANGNNLIWYPRGKQSEELILSESLKEIKSYALEGCQAKKVQIPSSVTEIGEYAFLNARIASITLPPNLTHIRKGIFQNCSQLQHITLGANTQHIGSYFLKGCTPQTLQILSNIPPVCEGNAFNGCESIFTECILYVPASSMSAYQQHPLWKKFEKMTAIVQ